MVRASQEEGSELTEQIEGSKTARIPFSRNFKLIVLNSGISRTGTSGFQLAILWIALFITKSPILAGLADGMSALPLLMSFLFGALVDKLPSKKALAIFISVVRVLSIFALFLSVAYSNIIIETLSIYFVAFVIGMSTDILNSVRSTWGKQFLGEAQYQSGTSIAQSVSAIAEGVGYGISGVLILLGIQYAVYSFSLIFAVSIIPLAIIRNDKTDVTSREKNLQSAMMMGLKAIFGDSRLRALIIIVLAINLAMGTFGIFVVYLVEDHFHLSAIYYTTLALSVVLGTFIGAVIGSKARGKIGHYSIGSIFPIALMLVAMGNINSIIPDYAITLAIGVLIGLINVVVGTAIMRIVEQEMMARVSGAINTFGVSLTFISGAIGGVLIQLLSLRGAFMLIGVILAAVSFLPLLFSDFYNIRVDGKSLNQTPSG